MYLGSKLGHPPFHKKPRSMNPKLPKRGPRSSITEELLQVCYVYNGDTNRN